MPDLEDPESVHQIPTTASEAFDQALAGTTLFGCELEPWSSSRIVAANSMGLVWPLPPEAADQLRGNGVYAGALRDTLIHCWLRTIKNASEVSADETKSGTWNVQRATRAPREAFDAALAWGEAKGLIDINSPQFTDAYKITLAKLIGVNLSEFDVEAPEGEKPDNVPSDPNV